MTYFINLKNGVASVSSAQHVDAVVTDMQELLNQLGNDESEPLSASLNLWIEEEAKNTRLECQCMDFSSVGEFRNFILGEADFLDYLFNMLEIDHTEDPEIRGLQLAEFEDFKYNS